VSDETPKLSRIRITGGPGPANVEIRLDGERMSKATRFVLTADQQHGVRVTTERLVAVDVEQDGEHEDLGFSAVINLQGAFGIAAAPVSDEGHGKTIGQAVAEAMMTLTDERIREAEARIEEVLAKGRQRTEGVTLGGGG